MNEITTFHILKQTKEVLVFVINSITTQICVKICPVATSNNTKEIEIYERLNELMRYDKHIKNKILKMYNYGFFTAKDRLNGAFKLNISNVPNGLDSSNPLNEIQVARRIKQIINKIYDYEVENKSDDDSDGSDDSDNNDNNVTCKLQYLITDYDSDFVSIDKNIKIFKSHYETNPDDLYNLLEGLFNVLIYLYKTYGFIHWDLHYENLLVNKNNFTEFLLFDFNYSEMFGMENNEFIEACNFDYGIDVAEIINQMELPDKISNKRNYYGLVNDITKYFISLKLNLNIDMTNFNFKKGNKIIEILVDVKPYEDLVEFYTKIIPDMCIKFADILDY